jgi:hypothetical protein
VVDRIKVRSMVGLLPLCAVNVYRSDVVERLPQFMERVRWLNEHRRERFANLGLPGRPGVNGRFMLSLLSEDKIRRVLRRMLDPAEFLGDYGIRSLSRFHLQHPYTFMVGRQEYRVNYLPAESGQRDVRGKLELAWAHLGPVNTLIIRALLEMYSYFGDEFRVECPTGSGAR